VKTLALSVALWLGLASGAWASEAPELCAPEVQLRSVQLSYKGHPGVWFDVEVARCLLERVQAADQHRALIGDYEERHLVTLDLLDLTERQRDLAVLEADRALVGLKSAVKLQGEAERKLQAPGRSRGLWFAVGLVSGVVLVGLSAYALSATR